MCYLFFNLSGIFFFYLLIFMCFLIGMVKFLGNIIVKYCWFVVLYLILMFFFFLFVVFVIFLVGIEVLVGVGILILCLFVFVVIIKVFQNKKFYWFLKKFQNWKFFFICFCFLKLLDRFFVKMCGCCKICSKNEEVNVDIEK